MPYTPVRFPKGVTNASVNHPTAFLGKPDSRRFHEYLNDFDSLAEFNGVTSTASWVNTATGAGSFALADGDGGLALLTNAAGGSDANFYQRIKLGWTLESGKQNWFSIRLKVSDATLSAIVAGLQSQDTTPLAVSDGVFFIKPTAAATVNFSSFASGTGTTLSAIATMVADTFMEWSWWYDGNTTIYAFINGARVGQITTNIPTAALTLSFGLQNGEAVAKNMTIDYINAVKERYVG